MKECIILAFFLSTQFLIADHELIVMMMMASYFSSSIFYLYTEAETPANAVTVCVMSGFAIKARLHVFKPDD